MHSAAAPDSGGIAMVRWLPDVLPAQLDAVAPTLQIPADSSATVVCVTSDADHYWAESYSPAGTPIEFCGHGALAAAWFMLHEHKPDAPALRFINRQRTWQARRAASDVADIALTYARPRPLECEVPDFVEACLGSKPLAAAEVGADTDYLILEFSDAATVQSLEPNADAITAVSQRAFIATARADDDKPACVFRYFAPQYGDPEDAATGSAAVQLAAYWSPRLNVEQFTARQLSRQSATMQLTCHDDVVELSALVGYG